MERKAPNPTTATALPPMDRYRSYLLLLARIRLGGQPQAKIDPSDIVQQTMIEAHVKQRQFQGDESGYLAWLRRALENNLTDALRRLRRQKRNAARERPLDESNDESSRRLTNCLAALTTSPSTQVANTEELLRLTNAIETLPETQREAIVLHHLQGWTLSEVANALERSDTAVAGLIHRGLRNLRKIMSENDE
jgi:RNA polymerase sigma-70 factor (ECF subfamily)